MLGRIHPALLGPLMRPDGVSYPHANLERTGNPRANGIGLARIDHRDGKYWLISLHGDARHAGASPVHAAIWGTSSFRIDTEEIATGQNAFCGFHDGVASVLAIALDGDLAYRGKEPLLQATNKARSGEVF